MRHCYTCCIAPGWPDTKRIRRTYVLSFGKISRTLILSWDEVAHCHRDSVRRAGVGVARVIVGGRWEEPVKGFVHAREPMLFWS